jgi:hypothetical protein
MPKNKSCVYLGKYRMPPAPCCQGISDIAIWRRVQEKGEEKKEGKVYFLMKKEEK